MTNSAQETLRLVYYSRNRITDTPESEIDQILQASRRNNGVVGVTGALIFNSGIFAQVLEGSLSSVETTFEKIQRDPRHGDVQVLSYGPIEGRAFPDWSMGFLGRSRSDENIFRNIAEATGFDLDRLDGDRLLSIMMAIALDEETRAEGEAIQR